MCQPDKHDLIKRQHCRFSQPHRLMNSAAHSVPLMPPRGGYAPWLSLCDLPPRESRVTAHSFSFVASVSGVSVMMPDYQIGSVGTPIKLALIEMLKHGALRNQRGGSGWKSLTGKKFHSHTVISLASKNLAMISVNKRAPGAQFVRLNQIGQYVARAVMAERDLRAATTIAPQISGEYPKRKAMVI